jgi:hypothetical protein
MYRAYHSSGVLGKAAHLALLGVGILILGPIALAIGAALLGIVVAIVGTALPFVVIGGIFYAPYALVRHLRNQERERIASVLRRAVPEVPPAPVRLAFQRPASTTATRRPRGVVARVIAEVFCGALVGGTLGVVAVVGSSGGLAHVVDHTNALMDYSALGAGIGAVVGFVVGGPRPTPAEKTPAVG